MSDALKEQIMDQLAGLSDHEQRRILDFARTLARSSQEGVAGRELVGFAGAIRPEDLDAMARAIDEGCEKIDLNEW
jgi:hypothetical protein